MAQVNPTRYLIPICAVAVMLAGCGSPDLTPYSRIEVPDPEGKAHDTFGKSAKPEKERETSESYYGKDGKPALDKEGVHKKVWAYDESGNKVSESYFGLDEKPVLCKFKYHEKKWEYDKNGQRVSESYWGLNGEPVLNNLGMHEKKWEHEKGEPPPFAETE